MKGTCICGLEFDSIGEDAVAHLNANPSHTIRGQQMKHFCAPCHRDIDNIFKHLAEVHGGAEGIDKALTRKVVVR